jgi:hypothetical protein
LAIGGGQTQRTGHRAAGVVIGGDMKKMDGMTLDRIQGGGWWGEWGAGVACGFMVASLIMTAGTDVVLTVAACAIAFDT